MRFWNKIMWPHHFLEQQTSVFRNGSINNSENAINVHARIVFSSIVISCDLLFRRLMLSGCFYSHLVLKINDCFSPTNYYRQCTWEVPTSPELRSNYITLFLLEIRIWGLFHENKDIYFHVQMLLAVVLEWVDRWVGKWTEVETTGACYTWTKICWDIKCSTLSC